MQKNADKHVAREFLLRQGRQLLAIAIAVFLVLLMAVLYKRHDLTGTFSDSALVTAQLVVITAFIGFTAFNWRCPKCKKYLGPNISSRVCRHCRTRLR